MTQEELAVIRMETAHLDPVDRMLVLRGLGLRPPMRCELAPGLRAAVRAASGSGAPPPPDYNAAVRGAVAGRVPAPPMSPRPTVTRVTQGRSAPPPPPDYNAAIRAAVAARGDMTASRAVVAAAPAVVRSAATDRTAPPPPDFNAAVRAAHQKASR